MKNESKLVLGRQLDCPIESNWIGDRRNKEFWCRLSSHLVLIIAGVAFLFPLLWMFLTSLKTNHMIYGDRWLPIPPTWSNYPRAVNYIPFVRYTMNTLFICVMCVIGTIISCVLPAYGFARIKWRGREIFFMIMLATLMLPFQATMVPLYIIFRNMPAWLGGSWIGDPAFKALWVPSFFGMPFFIFLLRQFFLGIPEELSDSARIDGCNEMGILWRIIVPLSKSAVITTALFTFMWNWNDFMWPLICINDESQYTLSLALSLFLSSHGGEWGLLMAMSTITMVPMILLFFFAQKSFVEGITMTGIKG